MMSSVDEFEVRKIDPTAGLEGQNDGFQTDGPKKMEDTFWPGKRALIPRYDGILELDKRVIDVRNSCIYKPVTDKVLKEREMASGGIFSQGRDV